MKRYLENVDTDKFRLEKRLQNQSRDFLNRRRSIHKPVSQSCFRLPSYTSRTPISTHKISISDKIDLFGNRRFNAAHESIVQQQKYIRMRKFVSRMAQKSPKKYSQSRISDSQTMRENFSLPKLKHLQYPKPIKIANKQTTGITAQLINLKNMGCCTNTQAAKVIQEITDTPLSNQHSNRFNQAPRQFSSGYFTESVDSEDQSNGQNIEIWKQKQTPILSSVLFKHEKSEITVEFSPATPKQESQQISASSSNRPKLPKNLLEIVKIKYVNTQLSNLEKDEEVRLS